MEKIKNLRQLIYNNRKTFLEQQVMPKHEIEIQNLIGNLDEVAVSYEARWGGNRLHELVSDELRDKWLRQYDRLCEAISNNDYPVLQDLVPGTIRGYAALEAAALARGCVPYDPVFWEVQLPETNRWVRIVKNNTDAAMVLKEGVEVWTLQEIARVLDEKLRPISEIKKIFPDAKLTAKTEINWKNGDEIPW